MIASQLMTVGLAVVCIEIVVVAGSIYVVTKAYLTVRMKALTDATARGLLRKLVADATDGYSYVHIVRSADGHPMISFDYATMLTEDEFALVTRLQQENADAVAD